MHGVMGFGVLGLVFKLQKWDESALFFDGCSLGTLTLPMRILHNPAHVPPSDPIMAKLMNGLPSSHFDYSAALSCPVLSPSSCVHLSVTLQRRTYSASESTPG